MAEDRKRKLKTKTWRNQGPRRESTLQSAALNRLKSKRTTTGSNLAARKSATEDILNEHFRKDK